MKVITWFNVVPLVVWLSALSLGVLAVDLSIPLGVAAGVPYVTVVLLSLMSKEQNTTIIWATICTVLTLVGYYASPVGGEVWKVVFNRVLAIYAIWAVAIVSLVLKKRATEVVKLEADLMLADFRSTLGLVAEHTRDAVIITDSQGGITWVNHAFTELSGYTLAEVTGKKPGDMLQGKDTSIVEIKRLSQAIKQGKFISSEIINYTKEGTPYWIDISISPVHENGELTRFIAVERDITERKELELKLEQERTIAVAGSEQRSRLFSLLHHEVVKPVNHLSVLGDNMYSAEDVDEIKATSMQIQCLTRCLSLITDNLSTLAEVDGDNLTFECQTNAPQEFMDTLGSKLKLLVEAYNLPFSTDIDDAVEGLKVRSDQRVTETCLMFLTLLAVSKSHARELSLSVRAHFNDDDVAMCFELAVKDDGTISQFIDQLSSYPDQSNKSLEAGLSAGYELITTLLSASNGRVSTYHDGELSRIAMHERYEVVERAKASSDGELKVLIAEDNKVNVIVLTKLLKSLGYESIDVAADGQKAVEMAQDNFYQLILMDNHMPNLTGLDATKVIVQDKQIPSIVIACTADTGSEARAGFFANGASDVIYKPIKKNVLDRAITDAFDKANKVLA
ncbi:PAS domain S-box protein [Vibrio sp. WXL103]|uniref:PAS domain S-box protein n=1 Tax=Vibrio sp. WXL103 TaxID=3450710 RepID=UPI003EC55D05